MQPRSAPDPFPTREARAEAEAYASWLHYEHRLLSHQLWPSLGTESHRLVMQNSGSRWHFDSRPGMEPGATWDKFPKPSTRIEQVVKWIGIEVDADRDALSIEAFPELLGGAPRVNRDVPKELLPLVLYVERMACLAVGGPDCFRGSDAEARRELVRMKQAAAAVVMTVNSIRHSTRAA